MLFRLFFLLNRTCLIEKNNELAREKDEPITQDKYSALFFGLVFLVNCLIETNNQPARQKEQPIMLYFVIVVIISAANVFSWLNYICNKNIIV